MSFHAPKEYMVSHPIMGMGEGNNGFFRISRNGVIFQIISSDSEGWEHVSVTIANKRRCPHWEDMCMIKNLFWDDEDVVIQFHPAKKDYVNNHPYCLHLWRPIGIDLPTPNRILVGLK